MWYDNKVRKLIAVNVLHTSLLNITVLAFKVLPLGSYEPLSAPSPPFKTILEMVLWNGFQSCHHIEPSFTFHKFVIFGAPSPYPAVSH
jgi:hypothetical protein